MEWKDVPRRAYYEKYERVQVKNDYGWYEVYRLPEMFTDLQSRSISRK